MPSFSSETPFCQADSGPALNPEFPLIPLFRFAGPLLDSAIQKWINDQLDGKSCTVVLVGANTAGRKWIDHEIVKTWNDKKGVLGIYVHNLKDNDQKQTGKGSNPFDGITVSQDKKKLSSVVKAYDPPYSTSTDVYNHIKQNLATWVETAISIRANF